MRERRFIQVTLVANIVVLSLGVAAWATEATGLPAPAAIALGGEGEPATPTPSASEDRMSLPLTEDADLPEPHPSARMVALPTHELEYLPPGLRQGILAGDADLDGGCVWIETADGRQAILWPTGFRAGFVEDGAGTVELVDASGLVVARGGDTVYFTGARSGGAESLERCGVGDEHPWYLGGVTAESPFE